MAGLKHPHEGRVAEVYRENEFVGYTPEPIEGAQWAPWGAWVLPANHDWRPDMRWACALNEPAARE
jgi:hypothetical protein